MNERRKLRNDNRKRNRNAKIRIVNPIPEDRVTSAISQTLIKRMVERNLEAMFNDN